MNQPVEWKPYALTSAFTREEKERRGEGRERREGLQITSYIRPRKWGGILLKKYKIWLCRK